ALMRLSGITAPDCPDPPPGNKERIAAQHAAEPAASWVSSGSRGARGFSSAHGHLVKVVTLASDVADWLARLERPLKRSVPVVHPIATRRARSRSSRRRLAAGAVVGTLRSGPGLLEPDSDRGGVGRQYLSHGAPVDLDSVGRTVGNQVASDRQRIGYRTGNRA